MMVILGPNVKHRIFMNLLKFYCCAVVGINTLIQISARDMKIFKISTFLLLPECVLLSRFTIRNLI